MILLILANSDEISDVYTYMKQKLLPFLIETSHNPKKNVICLISSLSDANLSDNPQRYHLPHSNST